MYDLHSQALLCKADTSAGDQSTDADLAAVGLQLCLHAFHQPGSVHIKSSSTSLSMPIGACISGKSDAFSLWENSARHGLAGSSADQQVNTSCSCSTQAAERIDLIFSALHPAIGWYCAVLGTAKHHCAHICNVVSSVEQFPMRTSPHSFQVA